MTDSAAQKRTLEAFAVEPATTSEPQSSRRRDEGVSRTKPSSPQRLAEASPANELDKKSTAGRFVWKFDPHMYAIFALVFVTALVIFAALRFAGVYYLTALAQRPQHALHQLFKSSGVIGQGLGVIGGLFCVLTLLYPLRKRWRALENLGTPRVWFQFHVYFGIAGPLLATLHTTFKFNGVASICYWAMMIVMASGFVGRFLFALLPRNQRGVILSLQEIEAEIRVVQQHLAKAGLDAANLRLVETPSSPNAGRGWRTLLQLMMKRRRELYACRQHLRTQKVPTSLTRRVLSVLARKLFLESSRLTLDLTTRVFSLWHTLHLPFTYLMFITLLVHAGLAIVLGYTWIF